MPERRQRFWEMNHKLSRVYLNLFALSTGDRFPDDVHSDDLRPGFAVSRNVTGVQDWF